MSRVAKSAGHAARREEFLDAAQHLVYAKGYQRVTIQDVLDELDTSKGAFYHYFDSKLALLEALVERVSCQAEALLAPVAHDPRLSALEKLQRFFAELARFRARNRQFLLAVLQVWYMDDNAVFREKTRAAMTARGAPLLAVIIGQGIEEGVLASEYPDVMPQIVMAHVLEFNEALGRLMISSRPGPPALQAATRIVEAYGDTLERLLRAPVGSLRMADAGTLRTWFTPEEGGG